MTHTRHRACRVKGQRKQLAIARKRVPASGGVRKRLLYKLGKHVLNVYIYFAMGPVSSLNIHQVLRPDKQLECVCIFCDVPSKHLVFCQVSILKVYVFCYG